MRPRSGRSTVTDGVRAAYLRPMSPGPSRAVLHVAHHALPHIGGLETVVAAETRELAARGWGVSLLTSAYSTSPPDETDAGPGVRVQEGVRTVRLRSWNGLESRFAVPFPVFTPWLLVAMAREVRRAGLVHVHDPLYLSSWAAALWCLLLRRPYVVHRHVGFVHHSSWLVRLVQRVVLGSVARVVLNRASAIVAIDERIAAEVRGGVRDPGRVHVLGNGVDTTLFQPSSEDDRLATRRRLGLPEDRPLVLFVGRFVPKKGFAVVAAAASDDYDVVFVGGDRPAAVTDPRLHFLGGLPASEMPAVYGCADIMVVASVGECPLTVIEAMSVGLPVVLNDDPALHTDWTSGPGVRFVDMAGGGLPAALSELAGDLPLAREVGADGLAHVRSRFSWQAHVDRLEQVYDDVSAGSPPASR